KGVKNVVAVESNAVAVVADTWWHAKTALDALPITWDEGPGAKASSATIAAMLQEGLTAETPLVGNKAGDVNAALTGAAKKVEAVYAYPYHAPVVAQRGHDPGHLSPYHAMQAHRGIGRQQQPDRPAHADFRPVDHRRHRAVAPTEWTRSRDLPRTQSGRHRRCLRLRHP